ncbi:DUF5522 domain-containing protein [Ferruginibacter sp.]|jgi:hypothetical protein|uniref:DUF5522 domain-containing protein n=1 Tax=Ferruginibacter sp. TaxID=1940288 RepID=UPI00265A5FB0|nr:DUF5522 domain-containing protein [Ferruginibacter sp.]
MGNMVEGTDFYYNEQGYVVFTAAWHLQRGSCCGNGCKHCPFNYINVPNTAAEKIIPPDIDRNEKA